MGAFMNQHRPRGYVTLAEAAARFHVSPQALAVGVRRGALRFKRVARHTWVTPQAVAAFLAGDSDGRTTPARRSTLPASAA